MLILTCLAKYDVKDGFYLVMIRPEHALAMTVILPAHEGEEPMVAVPLVLAMGWINSPPTFCAVAETACDIANDRMGKKVNNRRVFIIFIFLLGN